MRKKWKCADCGESFSTDWIPVEFVKCPNCGSGNVYRVDTMKGRGFRQRRRGICRR